MKNDSLSECGCAAAQKMQKMQKTQGGQKAQEAQRMKKAQKALHLENLPRSVELERAGDGRAQFAFIDERKLPGELAFVRTDDWRCVVDAVKTLAVRGAPAIGVAGAAAVALWACNEGARDATGHGCIEATPRFFEHMEEVAEEIASARPTAVNLAWAVRRMERVAHEVAGAGGCADSANALAAEGGGDVGGTEEAASVFPYRIADALIDEVKLMEREDEAANRAIGAAGAHILPQREGGLRILTHCNAGSLGTVFFGTALGIVYSAAEQGKVARVYADETRPVGQGARLTTWELSRVGIPVTLICDNMAASLMAAGKVDAVIVGADRIAANGDVANKIGTYGVAVAARHHGIPFYVAAPAVTVDAACVSGASIPIEQRAACEVLPNPIEGVEVWNPAFDVTPAELITAIVTEKGIFRPEEVARAVDA